MQVEDPVSSGGAEERRLSRMENTPQAFREPQGLTRGGIACPPLEGRQSAKGGRAQPFGFTQGHEPVEWQMMPLWWIREIRLDLLVSTCNIYVDSEGLKI